MTDEKDTIREMYRKYWHCMITKDADTQTIRNCSSSPAHPIRISTTGEERMRFLLISCRASLRRNYHDEVMMADSNRSAPSDRACLVVIRRRPPLPATSFSIPVTSWWCSTAAIHGHIPGWERLSTEELLGNGDVTITLSKR